MKAHTKIIFQKAVTDLRDAHLIMIQMYSCIKIVPFLRKMQRKGTS